MASRFPDVQQVLVDALELFVGADRTAIETPLDLDDRLPFVRVMRVGGPRGPLNDLATVDIDVFAGTYADARDLADDIAEWLVGPAPGVAQFDEVSCDIAPRELPWDDEEKLVRRFAATFRVVSRRRSAA